MDPEVDFILFRALYVWFYNTQNRINDDSDRYHLGLVWVHSIIHIFYSYKQLLTVAPFSSRNQAAIPADE